MYPIFINDVSLRDGEQAPGNTMAEADKLRIAQQLVALGINGIEAGFPAASPGDFRAVERIASEVGPRTLERAPWAHPRISALARLNHGDIAAVLRAVKSAPHHGIHTFISTSDIQRIKFADAIRKRGGDPESTRDFIDLVAVPGIEEHMAFIRTEDPHAVIQFSPEDWTRTEDAVSDDVVLAAAVNGATVINLPDTVGTGDPEDIQERVARTRVLLDRSGFPHVVISWHGHNDNGQAVANAIAALKGGAGQIEPTIQGIGERTGNLSFEGLLAAFDSNRARYELKRGVRFTDTIVRTETVRTSQLVSSIVGFPIPREFPIVGANAFAHESGIHQDGVLKGRRAGRNNVYEIFNPEEYGAKSTLVLGKHSGAAAFKEFARERELPFGSEQEAAFRQALSIAADDRSKGLSNDEVLERAYYPTVIAITGGPFITDIELMENKGGLKRVSVCMRDGQQLMGIAENQREGHVNAAVRALRHILPTVDIADFDVRKLPTSDGEEGSAAQAVATVEMRNGITVRLHTVAEDVSAAGLEGVRNAFNALYAVEEYARSLKRNPVA